MKNTELKNEPSAHKRTMSSVDIAEMTGKRHSDVMRSIRAMELTWIKISERKFASASYKDEQGKPRPMYLLDYRECMYIATKFNDEARAKLILRWDELEKEDRAKESNALPDPTYPFLQRTHRQKNAHVLRSLPHPLQKRKINVR